MRQLLSELSLRYVVGVSGSVTVWPPARQPLPPPAYSGRGRVAKRMRLGGAALPQHHPQSVKQLALELGPEHWHAVTWREGTNAKLRSRFARVRVRAAHRDNLREALREPEWLLIEWPEGDAQPLKYWLSTLPEDTPLERMVFEAKMRWRIERDYQELKQDLGLGHYEGRGWRGLHHHASLSTAAYGFLLAQRLRHPDEAGGKKTPHFARNLPYPRTTSLVAGASKVCARRQTDRQRLRGGTHARAHCREMKLQVASKSCAHSTTLFSMRWRGPAIATASVSECTLRKADTAQTSGTFSPRVTK